MGLTLGLPSGKQLTYGMVNLQGKAALNITSPLLEGINVVYNLEAQELPNGQACPRCTYGCDSVSGL